jgi:hypothetical protein
MEQEARCSKCEKSTKEKLQTEILNNDFELKKFDMHLRVSVFLVSTVIGALGFSFVGYLCAKNWTIQHSSSVNSKEELSALVDMASSIVSSVNIFTVGTALILALISIMTMLSFNSKLEQAKEDAHAVAQIKKEIMLIKQEALIIKDETVRIKNESKTKPEEKSACSFLSYLRNKYRV